MSVKCSMNFFTHFSNPLPQLSRGARGMRHGHPNGLRFPALTVLRTAVCLTPIATIRTTVSTGAAIFFLNAIPGPSIHTSYCKFFKTRKHP